MLFKWIGPSCCIVYFCFWVYNETKTISCNILTKTNQKTFQFIVHQFTELNEYDVCWKKNKFCSEMHTVNCLVYSPFHFKHLNFLCKSYIDHPCVSKLIIPVSKSAPATVATDIGSVPIRGKNWRLLSSSSLVSVSPPTPTNWLTPEKAITRGHRQQTVLNRRRRVSITLPLTFWRYFCRTWCLSRKLPLSRDLSPPKGGGKLFH